MKVQEQREHGNSNILQVAGPPRRWALDLQKTTSCLHLDVYIDKVDQICYLSKVFRLTGRQRMGGLGSGRRSSRATTDRCLRIDLSYLKQLGMLKRHCLNRRGLFWTQHSQTVADLTFVSDTDCEPHPYIKITGYAFGQAVDCLVWLEEYRLPYGGERWYALCPITGKRCTTLVLPPGKAHFASVMGWDVSYSSQRECPILRGHRAIDKDSKRLRGLSKYTRTPTRQRLRDRLIDREVFVEAELDKLAQLIF